MIDLYIRFDGLEYPIPVNPSDITISQAATNTNLDIIGLGKVTRKGEPGLRTLRIKSFFPSPSSRYYNNIPALLYIQFIEKIWKTENTNNKVAWIYSMGGIWTDMVAKQINMYFVIEKFDYTYKGGDFDTEYTLSIKEYKEYGVEVTTKNFTEGLKSARIPSTVKRNLPGFMQDTYPTTSSKTYTTGQDDTLWSVAKTSTGDGSNWNSLYELNKTSIGDNPETIPPNTKLNLPQNWNSPTANTNTDTQEQVAGATSSSEKSQTKQSNSKFSPKQYLKEEVGWDVYTGFRDYKKVYEENQKELENFFSYMAKQNKNWETNKVSIPYKSYNTALTKSQQNYKQAERIYNDNTKTQEEKANALKELKESEINISKRVSSLQWSYYPVLEVMQGKYYKGYTE